MNEDERLAVSLKKGNQQSLDLLYCKYAPALMGIITRIAGNEEMAEDILHKSFLSIRDKIDTFDPSKTSLFTWMINMARQSAYDKIKPVRFKDHRFSETVFDLIYYKGLNVNDAAAAMNITVNELKINLRKAIKNIQELKVV